MRVVMKKAELDVEVRLWKPRKTQEEVIEYLCNRHPEKLDGQVSNLASCYKAFDDVERWKITELVKQYRGKK